MFPSDSWIEGREGGRTRRARRHELAAGRSRGTYSIEAVLHVQAGRMGETLPFSCEHVFLRLRVPNRGAKHYDITRGFFPASRNSVDSCQQAIAVVLITLTLVVAGRPRAAGYPPTAPLFMCRDMRKQLNVGRGKGAAPGRFLDEQPLLQVAGAEACRLLVRQAWSPRTTMG